MSRGDVRKFLRNIHSMDLVRKFVRFVFVGIGNTLFGYSVFAVCIFLNMHYSGALLMTTVLGALFNFKTIGHLVFRNGDNRLLFKFLAVYVFTYFLNFLALKLFVAHNVSLYLAGIILAFPMALISFFLFNKWVFAPAALATTTE